MSAKTICHLKKLLEFINFINKSISTDSEKNNGRNFKGSLLHFSSGMSSPVILICVNRFVLSELLCS